MSRKELLKLKREIEVRIEESDDHIGDGGGVFLSYMDESDYTDYDLKENRGWKGFYKKVFNAKDDETNT